jgi:hypothetical protein
MSTTAGIQTELDSTNSLRKIVILRENGSGSTTQYYAIGGTVAPGKARWTVVDASESDATNAAAITDNLLA